MEALGAVVLLVGLDGADGGRIRWISPEGLPAEGRLRVYLVCVDRCIVHASGMHR